MSNFNGNGHGISTAFIPTSDSNNSTSIPTIVSENVTPVAKTVKQVQELLLSLSLSPLPVAPKQQDNKKFNGKCPAFLDSDNSIHSVIHSQYQNELPSDRTLRRWFQNPENGIGCLGTDEICWIDIDLKNFDDGQPECDKAFQKLLSEYPDLKNAWLEKTRSGGYRIGVKLATPKTFTNFALSENGKHIGECLGHGRFTVLAPTVGYTNLNYPVDGFPVIDSLESIGIFKSGKSEIPLKPDGSINDKKIVLDELKNQNEPNTLVLLIDLVCSDVSNLLNNPDSLGDRSSLIAKVANELLGWENWLNLNKIQASEQALNIIHEYGLVIGLESARIDRIIETIDLNVLPAIHYRGGDSACFRKLKKINSGREFNQVATTIEESILMDVFDDGEGNYCTISDAFYKYSGSGYWNHLKDDEVSNLVAQRLRDFWSLKKVNKSYVKAYIYATENNKKNCLKYCRTALKVSSIENQSLRCFSDVTVNLATGEILEHSKEHYLISKIAHPYIENAECPKVFLDFVESSYGLDVLPLIRSVFSMILDPTAPNGFFPHFLGESRSGKGTMVRLIQKAIGNESVTSIMETATLATEEKRHQYLTGKSLVVFPDMVGYQTKLGAFYELIDNGNMSGRALFESHSYSKEFNCKFVVASVRAVSMEGSADGWDKRAIPIKTKKANSENDVNLGKKLESALAQIISWALSMDKKEREDYLKGSTKIESVEQQKLEQSILGEPVRAFIDICLEPDINTMTTISNQDMYQWYVAFCKSHGYKPTSDNKFVENLVRILPKNRVERKRGTVNGKSEKIPAHWKNIKQLPFINPQGDWICQSDRCSEGGLKMFLSPEQTENIQVTEQTKIVEQTEIIQPVEQTENEQILKAIEELPIKSAVKTIIESEYTISVESLQLSDIHKKAVSYLLNLPETDRLVALDMF